MKLNYNQELLKNVNIAILFSMEPADIDLIIGRNLRRLRVSRKLSQERLGEMVSCIHTKISALENGKEGMGKDIMTRICKALNVHPYEFYIEPDTPLPATALEKKALFTVREAEKMGVGYVAEEACEYTAHRIQTIKKEKKAGTGKSSSARLKTGSG